MRFYRFCISSALALCLCGLAAAQSNTGSATSSLSSESLGTSNQQQQSYSTDTPGTQDTASTSVLDYGAESDALASGQVGQVHVAAYAFQPRTFDFSSSSAQAEATVVDVTTITGPEPIGTPVNLVVTMFLGGLYSFDDPNQPNDEAYVSGSLGFYDPAEGNSGTTTENNIGTVNGVQSVSTQFGTTIGATIDLNYSVSAWSQVLGNGPTTTQQIIFGTTGFYTDANLPGVQIVSTTGYIYATPTPSGFAALGLGIAGFARRRRSGGSQSYRRSTRLDR